MGTVDRADDTMAAFSSRGPSAIDYAAKPDLVAPGVGIESLSDPDSAFYTTQGAVPADRHRADVVSAVSQPERHEHGGAGRQPAPSR